MPTIIAGRFDTQEAASAAADALARSGFDRSTITCFYVTPPGQHGDLPVVDNRGPSTKHTEKAGPSALKTAAAGGAAGAAVGAIVGGLLGGPATSGIGALAGAGVGAYGGALKGGVRGAGESAEDEPHDRPRERHAGVMVAVCADAEASRAQAISVLHGAGAMDIERTTGEWRDGAWIDFDAERAPQLVRNENG